MTTKNPRNLGALSPYDRCAPSDKLHPNTSSIGPAVVPIEGVPMCRYTCGVFNHPTSRTARSASRLLTGCVTPVAVCVAVWTAPTRPVEGVDQPGWGS